MFVCDSPGDDLARAARPRHRASAAATRSTSCGVARRLQYEVAANWKVIAENYNECYHCGPVHPGAVHAGPGLPGWRRWAGVDRRDPAPRGRLDVHDVRAPRRASRSPDSTRSERTRHKGELIYPNLLLSLSAEHVAAIRLVPRGASHTTVAVRSAVPPRRAGLAVVRPFRRRRPVGPRQPSGLGDVRAHPTGDVVARLAPEVGSHRWKTTPPTSPGGTAG